MDKEKFEKLSDKAPTLFLDCDGCLLASNEAMCKLLNRKYGLNHTGEEVTNWDYTDLYPTNQEEVEALFESRDFFDNVGFVKGARRYLTKYREKCIIITKGNFKNYIRKRLFFNDNGFKDIQIIPIPLNKSKSLINMKDGLFVDDCTYNLKESNAKYKIMFMEYDDDRVREWQKGWNKERITKW